MFRAITILRNSYLYNKDTSLKYMVSKLCPFSLANKPLFCPHPLQRLLSPAENDATLLDATWYVCLHILLHVVTRYCAKFETGQTFDPTTPNISFVP